MKGRAFLIRIVLTVLFLFNFSTSIFADNILPVPERFQEHSQWCWAGTSQATLEYYQTVVAQCDTADWAWSRSDCCGNPDFYWNHTCNQPNYMYGTSGSLQAILLSWGVDSDARSYALAQSTVTSEIDAGRPFVMRFGWTSSGGHFLVGRGIMGDNVYYMDPWPGNGYTIAAYNWVVSSANHTWTHTLKITTTPIIFADVPPGYWAEAAIYKIYNAGITKGCSENPLKYCPENPVIRTQMAVFLGRGIHGSSFIPPSASGIFSDVPTTYWAADWIEQFYNDGITSGCNTNPPRYCPYNNVTRAQMAIFLLRSKHGKNYTPPAASGIFSDVPLSYWAVDWIEQLYNEGITTGCATGPLRYCPENSVTRAQMAVFIMRTFGL